MGVFTTVGRWFKPRQARINLHPDSTQHSTREPVAIDLHTPPEDPDLNDDSVDTDAELEDLNLSEPEAAPPSSPVAIPDPASLAESRPPRSRQELIAELQRNYKEVLGIVRKVDAHLDEQGQRSHRLSEIAERFPNAADDLAGLRAGQGEVHQAITAVADALHSRDQAMSTGQQAMLARLDEIRGLMAENAEAERQLVGSLVEFRDVMGGVTAATDRLTAAVEHIEQRETERADKVVEAIRATRSGVYAATIVAGLCAVVALVLGFVALAL